jgi:hypothetical protein
MTDNDLSPRPPEASEDEQELRQRAIRRLQAKRGLMGHALAYVMVNLLLVAIWSMTSNGFFWPLIPILGWGIGLAFNAWDVFWPAPGQRQIEAEMTRLRRQA